MEDKAKKIKISSVTPMLSHGSDGKEPEIRIPEFKAAMRFWWRALSYFSLKERKDINYIQYMRATEAILFGDAEKNISPLVIMKKKLDEVEEGKRNMGKRITKKYGKRTEEEITKECLTAFNLELGFKLKYPEICKEYNNWGIDHYFKLLEVVSVLGGIGQRARRGYGVFRIDSSKIYSNVKLESIQNKMNGLFGDIYEVEESNYIEEENVIRRKRDYIPACNFPFVEEIFIGKKEIEFGDYEKNMKKGIGKNFDADKLYEKNKYKFKRANRYACPVYISACYKEETNKIIPVITVLNNTHISKPKEYEEYKKYVSNIVGECIK